jgi:hypothetical protein
MHLRSGNLKDKIEKEVVRAGGLLELGEICLGQPQ